MIKHRYVFAFIFMLIYTVVVSADVVIGAYYSGKEKIVQVLESGTFVANAPRGYLFKEPKADSKQEREAFIDYFGEDPPWPKFENGTVVHIEEVYLYKGRYWGVTPTGHLHSNPGWIPMEYLLQIYNHNDFEKENSGKFYEYTGNYNAIYQAKKVVFWQWPGSDREKKIYFDYGKYLDIERNKAYRDMDGREWGKAYYNTYRGRRFFEGWVCLSDPENINIPAFNPAPEPVKWVPPDIHDRSSAPMLIIILVIVLAAATAVLVMVFWRPNKTKASRSRL